MGLLQTITGKENTRGSSAQAHIFYVPSSEDGGIGDKELALSQVAQKTERIEKVQSLPRIPAIHGMDGNVVGWWYNTVFNVPDGVVMKIVGIVHRSGNFGGSERFNAAMLILKREEGPLTRIAVNLIGSQKSVYQKAIFEGRFDVIDKKTAQALGCEFKDWGGNIFSPAMQSRVFEVETVAPAKTSHRIIKTETLQNEEGEEVEIVTRRRARKLDL